MRLFGLFGKVNDQITIIFRWGKKSFLLPVLGIKVTVGHRVDRIVPPEEESEGKEGGKTSIELANFVEVRVSSKNGRLRSPKKRSVSNSHI